MLLVDRHELVRGALAAALARQPDLEVVGQAPDARRALTLAAGSGPAALVLDPEPPGRAWNEAVGRLRAARPRLPVVILSARHGDRDVERAVELDAAAYVLKSGPLEDLFAALRAVRSGGTWYAEEVCARLRAAGAGSPATPLATLTPRERQVLGDLARGLSKKEIARTLGLSVKTVEHHATALMRKLDIHDRVELTRYAIREGLVRP